MVKKPYINLGLIPVKKEKKPLEYKGQRRKGRIKYDKSKFELVREVLGNEVFRDKKTGKEYLIKWSKKGTPRVTKLKERTKCLSCETIYDKKIHLFNYCPVCKGKRLVKW